MKPRYRLLLCRLLELNVRNTVAVISQVVAMIMTQHHVCKKVSCRVCIFSKCPSESLTNLFKHGCLQNMHRDQEPEQAGHGECRPKDRVIAPYGTTFARGNVSLCVGDSCLHARRNSYHGSSLVRDGEDRICDPVKRHGLCFREWAGSR